MKIDEKILGEIQRYRNIDKYIVEQAAIPGAIDGIDDLGPLAPEAGAEGAGVPPPPPSAAEAPPAPDAATSEKVDVNTDPDVEKINDKGDSEEKNTDEGSEELDITDLVNSQKNAESKQEEYFSNLFSQLSNLESKLGEMDKIMGKLNALETKIEKYREKTPEEKLELRTYDSYPFNQKLSDFFDDKKDEMEKTGKNEYVLTSDQVKDINVSDIKNSFQPGGGDSYDNEFKR
jgi:hypothetical protein